MLGFIQRYARWLHTQWPAGTVEKLPIVHDDGSTNAPGVYVVGDLTGIPLLKFAAETGARAVRRIADDPAFRRPRETPREGSPLDLAIIGGGVAGMAAALEAEKLGLRFAVIEAAQPFFTIANFPKAKPIFTYPTAMIPEGELGFSADVKEPLLEELLAQTRHIQPRIARVARIERRGDLLHAIIAGEQPVAARRVIIAIGRSGDFRRLGVPGEDSEKVFNRLHDPKDFAGQNALVVGGGDSALESAIALAESGAAVTLSYRKAGFSRPKPENAERLRALETDAARPGGVRLRLGTRVKEIRDSDAILADESGAEEAIPNSAVFTMIGREAPLDFLRRSGVRIAGEASAFGRALLLGFFLFIVLLYDWKNEGPISGMMPGLAREDAFPKNISAYLAYLATEDRSTLMGTLAISMKSRSFYYTLLYTACIGGFGLARIRRRKTPYVTLQTATLFFIQLVPLFILPEIILPWLGYNGLFDRGPGRAIADSLFPSYISTQDYLAHAWPAWGHPRAYWRAYGLILAWPLMVYNVFTEQPLWGWLAISFVQTFVLIPGMIYFWGKGAYCGWICSCGGLAETMGDAHRHKMPHGPAWNRLNMLGQALLAIAFVLLGLRIAGWLAPGSAIDRAFPLLLDGKDRAGRLVNPLSWKWTVDVLMGGVLGVGLYFKYSGRVWCRFACPLAALMHVYARFSRFRIFAEKKKCISCNLCTQACHQGIDVMNFANKGLPMADPECVRCSACVQTCPTGVLQFGQIDLKTGEVLRRDGLAASPVLMRENKALDL